MRNYSEWWKSQVLDLSYEADVYRARDIVLDECCDLHQVYINQDTTLLVQEGVCIGTADRSVKGIASWAKSRHGKM